MFLILMTVLGLALVGLSIGTADHFPTQGGMLFMLFTGIVLAVIGIAIWGKHGSPFPWMFNEHKTEKLKSRRKLKRAALRSLYVNVRRIAMEKLSDPAVCARLAQMDPDEGIRFSAVEMLSDPVVLTGVAQNDFYTGIRMKAVERLTDMQSLSEIARQNNNSEVALAAAKKVNDPALYAELAKFNNQIGRITATLVTDQQLLNNIIFQGKYSDAKGAALKNLEDRKILTNVALKASDPAIRSGAVQKLPVNSSVIAQLAVEDQSAIVRAAAVRRVQDAAVINRAAFSDIDVSVRSTAIGRVWDFDLLKKALASGQKGEYREAVISRMIFMASNMEEFFEIPIKEVAKEKQAAYLEKAVSLARQNPEILYRINAEANAMIRSSHTDAKHAMNNHTDHTSYSDCGHHYDNGRWKHEDNTKLERFKESFQ